MITNRPSGDDEDLSNIRGFHLIGLLWLNGGAVLPWMSEPHIHYNSVQIFWRINILIKVLAQA